MIDVVAFVIMLPFHRSQPRTDTSAMRELMDGFESRGVKVVTDHPRCREATVEGLCCSRGLEGQALVHGGGTESLLWPPKPIWAPPPALRP